MPKAIWNGQVIAESDDTEVMEGNHYFPADSIDKKFIKSSNTTTLCPWKGDANYYTLEVDGAENEDAAWVYRTPKPAAESIRNRVAFWKGVRIES